MSQPSETSHSPTDTNVNDSDYGHCVDVVSVSRDCNSSLPVLSKQPSPVKTGPSTDNQENESALESVEITQSTNLFHSPEVSPPLSAPGQQEELESCVSAELSVTEMHEKGISKVLESGEVKATAEENQKCLRKQSTSNDYEDILRAELPFVDVETRNKLGNISEVVEEKVKAIAKEDQKPVRNQSMSNEGEDVLVAELPFADVDIGNELGNISEFLEKEVKATAKEREKPVRNQSTSDEDGDVLVAELPFADVEIGNELGNLSSYLEDTENKATSRKRHRRKRSRKTRFSSSNICTDSLLTELPFSSADIRAEFGISSTSGKSLKKKRKRTAEVGESDADQKKKKKKTLQPNYFVSIPITNPKIIGGIQAVQDIVLQKDYRLSKAMVTIGSLHITLLVIHLASEEEVKIAASTFGETKGMVKDALHGKKLVLPFRGIGHFRNEVVFASLADGDHMVSLYNIAEAVKKEFQEKGILSGDTKPFKPHLTFMKLSRAPKLRKQGVKKLDPKLYQNFVTHWFGDEAVHQLDLCSMLKKKQPSGYYHCESSISVGEKNESEPDDAELVSLSKRLVENAILKAVQQYLEETQNKNKRTDSSPSKTEESDNDSKK